MKNLLFLVLQGFVFSILTNSTLAQDCKPPEIIFNNNSDNIFTEEQEMYLGEAMFQRSQKDFRIIEDEEVNQYVRKIGNKIIKHLPPTNIEFQFYVVDLPEVNAFAMAGGRIFVTRKLIAFVKNEDELAGVIAHELGHGIVRHSAIDMTRYFKKILKVKSVGDRKDIFDKYNEFLDKRRTKKVKTSRSHTGKQQIEADKIGVFAMSAAGYDPNAFTSATDRLFETEGKTGSWFSDLFGTTSRGEKRLRKIIGTVEQIPEKCVDKTGSSTSEEFENWRTAVISYSNYSGKERISGLVRRKFLKPTLRDDIDHLEFSPDGKYIIAQDNSSIFILQKDPYKFLFRIDSPEANNASFTSDSQSVVFNTSTLRVEKWSIAQQKPVSVKEVFLTDGCFQTALSKDGQRLACFSFDTSKDTLRVDFQLLDVRTNEIIFEKKKFFTPLTLDVFVLSELSKDNEDINMFQTEFSPDNRYFIAGRVLKNKARGTTSYFGSYIRRVKAGKEGMIGFDFQTKQEIKIGKKLRDIIISPFTFLDDNKIIGQDSDDEENSGIFAFPSGKHIDKFRIKGDSFVKPHKGNYVLVRPLKNAAVGVFDLAQKKLLVANRTSAFDVHGDVFVSENKLGEVGLYGLKEDKVIGLLKLPESRFGDIRSLNVSPDLNWLAISEKSRGGIWSLYSGNRFFFVKGFRGAYFGEGSKVYADFAKTRETPRQIAVMDLRKKSILSNDTSLIKRGTQHGKYLVEVIRKNKEKTKKGIARIIIRSPTSRIMFRDIFPELTFEVRDVSSENLLWSRDFNDGMPEYYFSSLNNTVSFVWSLRSKAAKEIINENETLKDMASRMGDKTGDYLIQIAEADTGKIIGHTMVETGERSFRINRAEAVGDWLCIADSQNRVMFYSRTDGELKQRFFGNNFAVNKHNNTVAVGNLSGQVIIYDLITGKNIESMSFNSPVAYAQFGKYGKKLLVLTTRQEAFIFDVRKFGKSEEIATR